MVDAIAGYFGVTAASLLDEEALSGGERFMVRREAMDTAKGDHDETDLEERGGTMDDLGQILLKTLDSLPSERKEDFVAHCVSFGMHLRRGRQGQATGTDPKD
jgi:hypothetical protein